MSGNGFRNEFWAIKQEEVYTVLKAGVDSLGRYIVAPNPSEIQALGMELITAIVASLAPSH
eukprot:3531059-Pyramimonas_sp.AAC.1